MPILELNPIGKNRRRKRSHRGRRWLPLKLPTLHLPFQLPAIPPQYRNLLRAFFLGLIVALPLVWYLRLQNSQQAAAWWDDAWAYRRRIPITYTGSENLTEYQVLVEVDTATLVTAGKLQNDCDDLRFTNYQKQLLSYSIVGNTCNTTATKVWVKTDSIPQSDINIYMYYGNTTANSYQSERDTFSYSEEKTVGYNLYSLIDQLEVISLEPNNSISHNGTTLNLGEYETGQFTSIDQWAPVTAKKLFNADDESANTDMLVPVSWAGTEFMFYSRANNHNYYAIAPWGEATIDIMINGNPGCTDQTVTTTGSDVFCSNLSSGNITITSDKPIIIFSETNSGGYDQSPLHPSSADKWIGSTGNYTEVLSNSSGADYRYISSDDVSENNPADLGASTYIDINSGGAYGSSPAFLIYSANNPLGVFQQADSDGSDSFTYALLSETGTRWGSAVGNTDYVSLSSDQPATCTIYDGNDNQLDQTTLTSSNTEIYWGGFGTSNTNSFTTNSWYINCDQPVMAYFQKSTDSESGLWTYPMMRQFTYPTPTVGTLADEETPRGPVGYWKLDEGTSGSCPGGSDICDSSGRANHGTIVGDPQWMSEDRCISGKCLLFDGVDDRIDIDDSASLSLTKSLTIQGWFNVNATPGDAGKSTPFFGMTQKDGGYSGFGNYGFRLRSTMDIQNMLVSGPNVEDTESFVVSNTIEKNKWYFFSMTYDQPSSTYKFFINGQLVQSSTAYSEILYDSPNPFHIAYGDNRYWSGLIDEVKVYPYARSQTQVQQDYNSAASGAGAAVVIGATNQQSLSDGLVGYWPMDETSGTTVADASGNGNDGTLTNAQETGTSDSSGNSTTTLVDTTSSSLSSTNDVYNGMILEFTATCGTIASGTKRVINDYIGSTRTFTFAAVAETPNSCDYQILHQVGGKYGNGLSFGATGDEVQVSSIPINTTADQYNSVAFWMKWDGSSWGFPVDSNSSARLWMSSSDGTCLGFNRGGGDCYGISTSGLENQWVHVVAVFYNGTYTGKSKIYINGEEQTLSQISGTERSSALGSTLAFSGFLGNDSYPLGGEFDEVRVYNKELSPAEVSQLYNFAPGPVGYWDFEEGSGSTAYDSSGNGNNGSIQGTVDSSTWTSGKYGKGLYFNGNNNFVAITPAPISGSSAFTISLWMNPISSINSDLGLIHSGSPWGSNDQGFSAMYRHAQNEFFTRMNNGLDPHTDAHLTISEDLDQKWSHYNIVVEPGNYIRYYLNGQFLEEVDISNSGIGLIDPAYIYLGEYAGSSAYRFAGTLDDVKIYNYARTPAQIRQDMQGTANSSIGSSTAGGIPEPVAHWSFDEQSGQTAHDQVGSNDGTLGADSNSGTDDPTWKTASECKVGGCLSFDGGDVVNTSLSYLANSSFTITSWLYQNNSPSNNQTWFSAGSVSGGNQTIVQRIYQNGTMRFAFYGDDLDTSSGTYNAGSWQHVAYTYDSNTRSRKVFVNNKLVGEDTANGDFIGNSDISIGSWFSSEDWNGLIDEVKIYNTALTADQIAQDMNQGSSTSFGGGSGSNTEAADITDGAGGAPVAEWNFEEKTGTTTADSSGNNNDGTFTGSPDWKSAHQCHNGACLEFDGSSEYLTVNDGGSSSLDLTTTGTIEVWAKSDRQYPSDDTNSFYRNFVNKSASGSTTNITYTFHWHGTDTTSNLRLCLGDGTNAICPSASIGALDTSRWYHFAASWNSSEIKWYVDGQLIETDANTITVRSTDDPVHIGGRAFNSTTLAWDGLLDDVKVYDYARTPAQVAYDYNRGGPIAHYKLDECQGATAHDSSGNNNHGTINIGSSGSQTSSGSCETSGAWSNGSDGKFNSSLNFDGTDDYIDLSGNSKLDFGSNDFSLSIWFKGTSFSSSNAGLIELTSAQGNFWPLVTMRPNANGTITYYVRDDDTSGTQQTTSDAYNDDNWHHAVLTRYGEDTTLYVDGKETVSTTVSGLDDINVSGYASIGRTNDGTNRYLNAQLDEAQIFQYSLSEAQVKKLYNGGAAISFE